MRALRALVRGRVVWVGLVACSLLHLALAAWARSQVNPETYVLTPYIEVQPGAAPLGADDAARLAQELQGPVDARKIAHGYAWLGSTMSLQDLAQGIGALGTSATPLTPRQEANVRFEMESTRVDYAQMQAVQRDILELERFIEREVRATLDALPPEQAAAVQAQMQRGPR